MGVCVCVCATCAGVCAGDGCGVLPTDPRFDPTDPRLNPTFDPTFAAKESPLAFGIFAPNRPRSAKGSFRA